MKKIMLFFLLVVLAVLSAGCSNNKNADLLIGNYYPESDLSSIRIVIEEDQSFELINLLRSSWPPKGNYKIKNEQVTLIIDDENKYVFDIKGDSLIYNASASTLSEDAETAYAYIEAGTKFTPSEN